MQTYCNIHNANFPLEFIQIIYGNKSVKTLCKTATFMTLHPHDHLHYDTWRFASHNKDHLPIL